MTLLEVKNVYVYGLNESCIASGYPMKSNEPNPAECTDKDIARMKRLGSSPSGSGHDCALKGIIVQFDLKAPIKVWTEAERYHWFDIVSSQSTIHRLSKMDIKTCMDESVDHRMVDIMMELQNDYLVKQEIARQTGNEKATKAAKKAYLKLLLSCPVGLNLTARVSTNYLQLKTIYRQRKNHRLPHWHVFCNTIEKLPYAKDFGVVD